MFLLIIICLQIFVSQCQISPNIDVKEENHLSIKKNFFSFKIISLLKFVKEIIFSDSFFVCLFDEQLMNRIISRNFWLNWKIFNFEYWEDQIVRVNDFELTFRLCLWVGSQLIEGNHVKLIGKLVCINWFSSHQLWARQYPFAFIVIFAFSSD